MSSENKHLAMDTGELSSMNKLFPFLTDKDTLIPPEQFEVVLYEDESLTFRVERSRYHTIYLDPAYKLECMPPYPEPRVALAMYDASITLRAPFAYGEDRHKAASDKAKELVGNDSCPRYFEEYIKAIHSDPGLRLVHILAAREESSRPPFILFGWLSPNSEIYHLQADQEND